MTFLPVLRFLITKIRYYDVIELADTFHHCGSSNSLQQKYITQNPFFFLQEEAIFKSSKTETDFFGQITSALFETSVFQTQRKIFKTKKFLKFGVFISYKTNKK